MIEIISQPFGTTKKGEPVTQYILTNGNGMCVKIISYACVVQNILVPDQNGTIRDVVLGYDTLEGYETGSSFFGAFVGRYANRIKNAEFELNGRTCHLSKNDGSNHLHGIYCYQVFDGQIDGNSVVFKKLSPAFEEGYPGKLSIEVRYTLTEKKALEIEFKATTDEDTVVNLTNHSYFNLNGNDGSTILDHELFIDADHFTETDRETLPTGKILSVSGTPMDFRAAKPIGRDIEADYDQLKFCKGFDHNLILNRSGSDGLTLFAKAKSPCSGIELSCYTTQPAVQLYTGNYADEDKAPFGKGGIRYPRYGGFCLETQHYPCSPNYPDFPSTVLKKDETYYQKTVYQFT